MNSGEQSSQEKGQPGFYRAALFGLCPQCSERTLFAAPARIADTCASCGLNLAELERGSRAAGVVTIVVAAALIGLALWIEDTFRPPLILQMIVWTVVTVAAVLGALRAFKTYMLMVSYERALERQSEHGAEHDEGDQ